MFTKHQVVRNYCNDGQVKWKLKTNFKQFWNMNNKMTINK